MSFASTVSLIILDWNTVDAVAGLLASLPDPLPSWLQVVLVDNGSDAPLEPSTFGVTVHVHLRSESNLGYAGGMNLGVKHATGEWLLLCNSDVVFSANFFSSLQNRIRWIEGNSHDIGFLGGLLLKGGSTSPASQALPPLPLDPDLVDSSGGRLSLGLRCRRLSSTQGPGAMSVSCLSGACFAVKRAVIEEVGVRGELFDPDYHSYGEDKDLWLRAIRGRRVLLYDPGLVARQSDR